MISVFRRALRRDALKNVLAHLLLIAAVLLTIYPIFFLLNVSVKGRLQFQRNPLAIEPPEGLYNYVIAWRLTRRSMLNTVVVTLVSLIGLLVTASATGYAFARYAFPGKEVLWYLLLGLLMIPSILTLVPLLVLVAHTFKLTNTLWAVILPYIAGGQAFNVFLLRTFFAQMPEELFEAARLDGANHLQIITRLVLPLSAPILIVVSMLHILSSWNDIAWPLLVLNKRGVRTLSLQLLQFTNPFEDFPAAQYAGAVIAAVPLVLMFALGMRRFISGVLAGALKV
jgi:ABC-type glycerol-3-phosphate transport system permease component